jgi:hypothetical protein
LLESSKVTDPKTEQSQIGSALVQDPPIANKSSPDPVVAKPEPSFPDLGLEEHTIEEFLASEQLARAINIAAEAQAGKRTSLAEMTDFSTQGLDDETIRQFLGSSRLETALDTVVEASARNRPLMSFWPVVEVCAASATRQEEVMGTSTPEVLPELPELGLDDETIQHMMVSDELERALEKIVEAKAMKMITPCGSAASGFPELGLDEATIDDFLASRELASSIAEMLESGVTKRMS